MYFCIKLGVVEHNKTCSVTDVDQYPLPMPDVIVCLMLELLKKLLH